MTKLLCLLALFALPIMATDSTATITTPDGLDSRLAGVVEKWIQLQNAETVKYSGATVKLRRQSLLDTILRDGVRAVFKAACSVESIADDCAAVKAAKNNRETAEADISAAINNIIQ